MLLAHSMPAAPGMLSGNSLIGTQHWSRIKLPKPRDLSHHFAPREPQAQT